MEQNYDCLALEEFYRTAEPTNLWKLIQEDLNSPEAQAYFERSEQIKLEDWAALRHQIIGHEDPRVL